MQDALRPRISLAEFANRRIGTGSHGRQFYNLLVRPFAAPTFIGFWRLWNPLYGYFLYFWSYRPLRRLMPRAAAEMLTFAVSGFFLHDVPLFLARRSAGMPYVTAWFVLAGAIAIAAERAHIGVPAWPPAARIALNAAYLFSTLCVVVALTLAA
jgi:hypothetical protein